MSTASPPATAEAGPRHGRLLTSGEVADVLRCTAATVRDWRAGGKLPAVRVGSRWLFAEAAVLALIATPPDEELRR